MKLYTNFASSDSASAKKLLLLLFVSLSFAWLFHLCRNEAFLWFTLFFFSLKSMTFFAVDLEKLFYFHLTHLELLCTIILFTQKLMNDFILFFFQSLKS